MPRHRRRRSGATCIGLPTSSTCPATIAPPDAVVTAPATLVDRHCRARSSGRRSRRCRSALRDLLPYRHGAASSGGRQLRSTSRWPSWRPRRVTGWGAGRPRRGQGRCRPGRGVDAARRAIFSPAGGAGRAVGALRAELMVRAAERRTYLSRLGLSRSRRRSRVAGCRGVRRVELEGGSHAVERPFAYRPALPTHAAAAESPAARHRLFAQQGRRPMRRNREKPGGPQSHRDRDLAIRRRAVAATSTRAWLPRPSSTRASLPGACGLAGAVAMGPINPAGEPDEPRERHRGGGLRRRRSSRRDLSRSGPTVTVLASAFAPTVSTTSRCPRRFSFGGNGQSRCSPRAMSARARQLPGKNAGRCSPGVSGVAAGSGSCAASPPWSRTKGRVALNLHIPLAA